MLILDSVELGSSVLLQVVMIVETSEITEVSHINRDVIISYPWIHVNDDVSGNKIMIGGEANLTAQVNVHFLF